MKRIAINHWHWWHWEGHGVKGQGQPVMAIKIWWTRQLLNNWSNEKWTKTYTNISYSRATKWLRFQGHKFKGQGHRNVPRQRHTRFAVSL